MPGDPADFDSLYTGLFTRSGAPEPRPHDPAVALWAGSVAPFGARQEPTEVGGAGWIEATARAAGWGEAIERAQAYALPSDRCIASSYRAWPLADPAVAPDAWVLFHAQQYQQPRFPFRPYTPDTPCRWVAMREAGSGRRGWVPEEFAFLYPRPGADHRITPSISTGLSCGRWGDPVLLRGLQEMIERDGIIGAWWSAYALEEWPAAEVLTSLGGDTRDRVERPGLQYRCYRVHSPFSEHVTIVTVAGDDLEGWLFSAGAACRETRTESWRKSLLEAIQGRHYVRYLKRNRPASDVAQDFADHALYYSLHPDRLERTVLHRPGPPAPTSTPAGEEDFAVLQRRLGPRRPVLFRLLTPPGIARADRDWLVLKVVVPGLQPLHGHHQLPHLGGSHWAPRTLDDWRDMLPHPFP